MSGESEPPTRIDSFRLTVRMDATLTVNGTTDQWLKPGTEASIGWRGWERPNGVWVDPIPTQEEIKLAFQMIQTGILAPVLEEMVQIAQREIVKQRQGGR